MEALQELTGGVGVDRAIDAVGVDADHADKGPASRKARQLEEEFQREVRQVAPQAHPQDGNWVPGDAPSQVLDWAVEAVAKAGTVAIIGVYPPAMKSFPLGEAMMKNLTLQMGNCNHRKYIPILVEMVRSGMVDPVSILSNVEPLTSVIDAYKAFDRRQPGWIKVEIVPQMQPAGA